MTHFFCLDPDVLPTITIQDIEVFLLISQGEKKKRKKTKIRKRKREKGTEEKKEKNHFPLNILSFFVLTFFLRKKNQEKN